MRSASSSASAFFTSMPARAPWPVPTMMAVGVARPSAHGQAMTSTATALISACWKSPTANHQPAKVSSAITTTTGTNTAAIRSARRCTGAFEPCACSTRRMMPASRVCAPTPVARQRRFPLPLRVAAKTLSPLRLSMGRLSPVSIASLTADSPCSTTPSTGTASPGRSTKRSPGLSDSTATSMSSPSRSISAIFGCRRSKASSAAVVRALARASISLPSSTSVMIIAEASKYTCRSWRALKVTTTL